MKHSGQNHVVDELNATRQQGGVLDPPHAPAHESWFRRREVRQTFWNFNRHADIDPRPSAAPAYGREALILLTALFTARRIEL